MENREELNSKVANIIREGRKYNMIDRFFHYSIEENELKKIINNLDLNENNREALKSDLLSDLYFEEHNLKGKIKESFGISNFEVYAESDKELIISNPNLLGISPFLFDESDWIRFIKNDIHKCKNINFHYIESIVMSSLTDVLNRLEQDYFILKSTSSIIRVC